MSTYTTWNGEQHLWPPPPGWYQAADGLWWPPSTPAPGGGNNGSGGNGKIVGVSAFVVMVVAMSAVLILAVTNRDPSSTVSTPNSAGESQAQQLRQFLNERNIPIRPSTTDDQLNTLGLDACSTVSGVSTLEEWNRFVTEETENRPDERAFDGETASDLDGDQVRAILNGSISIFCPEEATRLGITP